METLIKKIEKRFDPKRTFFMGEKESKLLEIDNFYRNLYHQMELNNYSDFFINSIGNKFSFLLDLAVDFLARDMKVVRIEQSPSLTNKEKDSEKKDQYGFLFNWKIFIIAAKIQVISYGLRGIISLCEDFTILIHNPKWRQNLQENNRIYLNYLMDSMNKTLYLMNDYEEDYMHYKKINRQALVAPDQYYSHLLSIIGTKINKLHEEYKKNSINCGFINFLQILQSFFITLIEKESKLLMQKNKQEEKIQLAPSSKENKQISPVEGLQSIATIIKEIIPLPNQTEEQKNVILLMKKIFFDPKLDKESIKKILNSI